MKRHRNSFLTLTLAASFVLAGENALQAEHPFHVSLAEIEFNSKSSSFEVSVCLWAEDIETLFTEIQGKPFDLEKVSQQDANELLEAYLKQRLVIRKGDQPLKMKWHGHELEKRKLWLYLEFSNGSAIDESDLANWAIENRLLFEAHEQQANLMQVKIGKVRRSHTATHHSPTLNLRESQKSPRTSKDE